MGGILGDNLGEGNCESKIASRQWGDNFCRETSICLTGPSGCGTVRAVPVFGSGGSPGKGSFLVFQHRLTERDGSGSSSQWAKRDTLMSRGKNCRETIFISQLSRALSFLSLFFLEFLVFSPCEEEFLVFLSVFPFFSRDFRGSVGIKNPCFWVVFLAFKKKKNKERKDRVITLTAGVILKEEKWPSLVGERQFWRHFRRQFGRG